MQYGHNKSSVLFKERVYVVQMTKRLINKSVLLLTIIVMLSSVFSFQSVKAVSNSKITEVIVHYKSDLEIQKTGIFRYGEKMQMVHLMNLLVKMNLESTLRLI